MPRQGIVIEDQKKKYQFNMESRHRFGSRSYSLAPDILKVSSMFQPRKCVTTGPIRLKLLNKRAHPRFSKRDIEIDKLRSLSNVYTRSVFSSIRPNRYTKSVLEEGWLSELFMFSHALRTQPLVIKIKEKYEEILSKDIDFQDYIYSLTPEGTRALFDLLKEPNIAAQETRKLGSALITDEQCAKFGKEPITLDFELGPTKDE